MYIVMVSLEPYTFVQVWLYGALQNGSVTQAEVDLAVSRVYRTHIKLGLLDPLDDQYYTQIPPTLVDSAAHRTLALTVRLLACVVSIVLVFLV